jgi:hypothetical protein
LFGCLPCSLDTNDSFPLTCLVNVQFADGNLDLILIKDCPKLGLLALMTNWSDGGHVKSPHVMYLKVSWLKEYHYVAPVLFYANCQKNGTLLFVFFSCMTDDMSIGENDVCHKHASSILIPMGAEDCHVYWCRHSIFFFHATFTSVLYLIQ